MAAHLCEQSVEKPPAVSSVDAEQNAAEVTLAVSLEQARNTIPDTTGQLIDQKSADEFQQELDHWVFDHRDMMALLWANEKTEKRSLRPLRNAVQLFPSWRTRSGFLC